MNATLKFVTISLDPKGCYIGMTRNGWVWYYHPGVMKWLLISGDEDNANNSND